MTEHQYGRRVPTEEELDARRLDHLRAERNVQYETTLKDAARYATRAAGALKAGTLGEARRQLDLALNRTAVAERVLAARERALAATSYRELLDSELAEARREVDSMRARPADKHRAAAPN